MSCQEGCQIWNHYFTDVICLQCSGDTTTFVVVDTSPTITQAARLAFSKKS